MFLTKEEILKESEYSLFDVPTQRLTSWFYYEPMPISKLVDIDKFIENNNGKKKYNKCNEYIAIRGAGDMFTYSKDIVVITIINIFKPEEVVCKKKYNQHFYIRVYFHTIDDSGRGIVLHYKNKEEYIQQIERIKDYLYQHPYMEEQEEFEKYWNQFNDVATDFN